MTNKKKILLITYYWPPSGGAGVQRWLKLTKYLAQAGVECHVVTVEPEASSYPALDNSLESDIHPDVKVYKTKSFEITNVYKRLVGKKNVPTSGFSNVDSSSWKLMVANRIRSNFFIPDPRVGWNRHAYRKAEEVIKRECISTVITTSPPHSTQMVGLRLKKAGLAKKWIADLRDPWTDIYYYPILMHSRRSHRTNLGKEKAVLECADRIITVSEGFRKGFKQKTSALTDEKFEIIPNGYDPVDFENLNKVKTVKFRIVYTGTISELYNPISFFKALECSVNRTQIPYEVQIIGSIAEKVRLHVNKLKLDINYIDTVPHSEINQYQKDADLLLLVIPDNNSAAGIVPGKLFEYLATGNRIVNIGPSDGDSAEIIRNCNGGRTFERDMIMDLEEYISKVMNEYKGNKAFQPNVSVVEKYSRALQARKVKTLIA